MWLKTGTVAINGWQALSAHDGIIAAEAKVAAAKALAKAEADLAVITKAEVAPTSPRPSTPSSSRPPSSSTRG